MQLKRIFNPANKLLTDRHSVRTYDTSIKISREEMNNILQDAMTAPSSLNLQPWRFVVIDTDESKEVIKPYMMFNQKQLETAAALILVLGDKESVSYTDQILDASVQEGLMSEEESKVRLEKIRMYTGNYTREKINEVNLYDCGLVSMQLMLSAKSYGYDTNPIGGFMKEEMCEVLGIDTARYLPVMLISIGKSAEKGNHETIRFSVDEIVQWK